MKCTDLCCQLCVERFAIRSSSHSPSLEGREIHFESMIQQVCLCIDQLWIKPREFQLQSVAWKLCENLSRRFFEHRRLPWWIESVLPRNSKEVGKVLWIDVPRSFRKSINRNGKADEFEKVIRLVGDFVLRVYKIIFRSLNSTVQCWNSKRMIY